MMNVKKLACGAFLGLAAVVASAAPVTYEFTGLIRNFYDRHSFPVANMQYTTMRGTITLDLGNATSQKISGTKTEYASTTGCALVSEGKCKGAYYVPGYAIITGATFEFDGGTYVLTPQDLEGLRSSTLGYDTMSLQIGHSLDSAFSDDGDEGQGRSEHLVLTAFFNDADYTQFRSGSFKLATMNGLCSVRGARCDYQLGPDFDSFSFDGTLTSLAMRAQAGPVDAVEVPEPASLALLGAALAGLGAVRRRRAG